MPSLYEATANTGEVSSSNFTTLYNASGLLVPNAGAGSITGNLNVGGNLTVQGTSLLIGDVTLQSTLSLPNYTFPLPDGTTDQVLVTDGNGNLFFSDVSAIPGANYNISATTATGGANLTLANTAGFTDSVKFAAGTNMTVVRTDANTITIATTADDIPNGTARGQVLYWDGSAWIASANIRSAALGDRLIATYEASNPGTTSSLLLRKDYGAVNYSEANNDGVGINYSVTSTAQGTASYGVLNFEYSTTDPQFVITNSTNNFSSGNANILILQKSTADLYAPNITLNSTQTGAPSLNASITVGRGSSTNATLTWDESQDRWEFNNPLEVQGQITGTSNLDLNGNNITLLSGTGGAPSQNATIVIDRGSSTDASLTWNEAADRFEFSDQLFITQSAIPAIFERRNLTSEINSPLEYKNAIRIIERVTDAANNDTLSAGPGITFSRTSGATDTTTRTFAALGAVWDGSNRSVDWGVNWSNDNYSESTPGTFPGTYTLLQLGSNRSKFYDDSLFINYSAQGATDTATSITGGNTLVFGVAHGFTIGDRIQYTSTTQNGLTQNEYYYVLTAGFTTTQCQLGLTSTGSAIALTNGTGLTLVFAKLVNRVGVNTSNPQYTLDVNGDLGVTGNITSAGITAGNVTVGVVTDNTISTTSNALAITAASGSNVEITSDLTSVGTGPTRIIRTTNLATGTIRALSLRSDSTTTPAIGLGTSLDYEVETAVGTFTRGGYIEIASTDITPSSEDFIMNFGVTLAGTPGVKATLDNTGTLTLNNDLAVNGGDITTTQTTASVFNTNATTVDAFGAATNITMGVDGATGAGGTTTIRSATTVVKGDLQVNGDNTGTIADITTTKTSASVFNTNATTVSAFGAATTISIGATTGTTTIRNDVTVEGVINADALTLDARSTFDTSATTRTSTAQFTLDSTTRNAIKLVVYMERGTDSHAVEILIMRTTTDAMMTTYGEMYTTSPLATFVADQDAGLIRVRATPTSATSTTFSVVRYSLT